MTHFATADEPDDGGSSPSSSSAFARWARDAEAERTRS